MTIMATAAVPRQHRLDQDVTERLAGPCPTWCLVHLGDEPSFTHLSADQVFVATSDPERTEVYVSVEMWSGNQSASVRLQGAGDAPMTPEQALQLAAALELAARQAMGR